MNDPELIDSLREPIRLSMENIDDYVFEYVLPAFSPDTSINDIQEITQNSYVNWVFKVEIVEAGLRRIIFVRQSRDYVKKYDDLQRDLSRTDTEARTLGFLNGLVPDFAPELILFDRPNSVLVLTDIKRRGKLLSDELAAGRAHPEAGYFIGAAIGKIQTATRGSSLAEILGNDVSHPAEPDMASYLAARSKRARALEPGLTDVILAESDAVPKTFILGDLASKNIFIDGDKARALDFERVFIGDPAYDPAYLFCHLMIEFSDKRKIDQSLKFIENFIEAYIAKVSEKFNQAEIDNLQNRIIHHLGMSILHRTAGSHFVSYEGSDKMLWQRRAVEFMRSKSNSVIDLLHALY